MSIFKEIVPQFFVHKSVRGETTHYVRHYGRLIGRTIRSIQIEDYDGQPCVALIFDDGSAALVMADEEGNGPGHLDIH